MCDTFKTKRKLSFLLRMTSMVTAVVMILSMVVNIQPAFAHKSGGYSYDSGVENSNEKWMTPIRDSVYISELSIPGTHETMANKANLIYGGLAAQCQSKTLEDQLNSGIRALDIRCAHYNVIGQDSNVFAIYHGPFWQDANFDDVLKICQKFLEANPGETILMRVKEEDTILSLPEPTRTFRETFQWYYSKPEYKDLIWSVKDDAYFMDEKKWFVEVPTLGDVRGQIVILDNFSKPEEHPYGIRWEDCAFTGEEEKIVVMSNQDVYKPDKLYDKWAKVKRQMSNANEYFNDERKKIYVNHLSANNPSAALLPYFVASGHITPATNGSRLTTGERSTEENKNKWFDFPRIKVLGIDLWLWKIYFSYIYNEGTNELLLKYLSNDRSIKTPIWPVTKRTGIIMADFPGQQLIDKIIDYNRQWKTQYISISEYTKEPTNQDITVTASTSIGNLNATSHTFTENGSFNFVAKDEAGYVIDTKTVYITNIDKVPPIIAISGYTTEPTNEDITVKPTTNEGTLNEESHTFTENGSFEFVAEDEAGNITIETVTITNIDKVPPIITVSIPTDNATYILREKVLSSWNTVDSESGIATSTATVEDGEAIDTASLGTKTFTVTATDLAGNSATKTVTYKVIYDFSGVLRPIKNDGTHTFKPGETIPVKFQLTDANGNYITDAVANIYYTRVIDGVVGPEMEAVSTSSASQGNTFRYDVDDNKYIYNLKTKGWEPGTYQLTIKLDDNTSHNVQISSK